MSKRRLSNIVKRRLKGRCGGSLRVAQTGFSQWATTQLAKITDLRQGFILMSMR